MSYLGISIKEAISNINNSLNSWYLPAIQRPYVWGSRYETELYICKLFDFGNFKDIFSRKYYFVVLGVRPLTTPFKI